jgi:hypothetical protein
MSQKSDSDKSHKEKMNRSFFSISTDQGVFDYGSWSDKEAGRSKEEGKNVEIYKENMTGNVTWLSHGGSGLAEQRQIIEDGQWVAWLEPDVLT